MAIPVASGLLRSPLAELEGGFMATRIGRTPAAKHPDAKGCAPAWRQRELKAQPKVAYGPARHKKVRPQKAAGAK